MKITVTCSQTKELPFQYLVSWSREFKIYINSSFPLITYSGQVLSFQDSPCNPQGFSLAFHSLPSDWSLGDSTPWVPTSLQFSFTLPPSPILFRMKPLSCWHFHKACQANSQCLWGPFMSPRLQINWQTDVISYLEHHDSFFYTYHENPWSLTAALQ